MFESTGDPLIDKWEKELAMGIDPDLTEGMAAEERAEMLKVRSLAAKGKKQIQQLSNIEENFNKGLARNPMYRNTSNPNTVTNLDLLGKGK